MLVPLCAPNQNRLVEQFNRVIANNLKECECFGWNVEQSLERLLFDYRRHQIRQLKFLFEVMYGRKMRNRLTKLHPEIREVPVKEIGRDQIADKQDKMKAHFESKKSPTEINIKVGDFVRVKKPDGWYTDFEEVIEVGNNPVRLKTGCKGPLSSVSAKTDRAIANQRLTMKKFKQGGRKMETIFVSKDARRNIKKFPDDPNLVEYINRTTE